MKLSELYPDPEELLRLEPEELGGGLLRCLASSCRNEPVSRGRFLDPNNSTIQDFPPQFRVKIRRALATAWSWLERESLIVADPDYHDRDDEFITERGLRLAKSPLDLENYRRGAYLRKDVLHPRLLEHVYATFLRGNCDTAVFEAFKEVEVAVRTAAGLPQQLIGTDLMRKAFNPKDGPLTKKGAHASEEQALSDLLSGAIGWAKNPPSHRDVEIPPAEAAELITLASYLLRVVDSRSPK